MALGPIFLDYSWLRNMMVFFLSSVIYPASLVVGIPRPSRMVLGVVMGGIIGCALLNVFDDCLDAIESRSVIFGLSFYLIVTIFSYSQLEKDVDEAWVKFYVQVSWQSLGVLALAHSSQDNITGALLGIFFAVLFSSALIFGSIEEYIHTTSSSSTETTVDTKMSTPTEAINASVQFQRQAKFTSLLSDDEEDTQPSQPVRQAVRSRTYTTRREEYHIDATPASAPPKYQDVDPSSLRFHASRSALLSDEEDAEAHEQSNPTRKQSSYPLRRSSRQMAHENESVPSNSYIERRRRPELAKPSRKSKVPTTQRLHKAVCLFGIYIC